MKTTSVNDVSNLFTVTGAVDKSSSSESKKSDSLSFAQFMNDTAGKSVTDTDQNDTVKQSKTVVEKPGRKDLDQETARPEEKQISDDQIETVAQAANQVKDAITEKFSISEEELSAVMNELGVTTIDLLDVNTLKNVIMEVTGSEDGLALLTNEDLYQNVMDVVNLASDLADQIKEELSISDEQFDTLIEDVKSMDVKPEDKTIEPVEDKAPEIRVEVTRSEESRTENPIEITTPVKKQNDSDNGARMEDDSSNQNKESEQTNSVTVTQTVETHQVGDIVETVRQFSSYVDGEEIVSQVRDSIKVNISPEETSMEMQLHPASLGTVNLNVQSQNGVVTAQLLVQSETVKEALASQLVQLQDSLEEQGLKVEAVEVAVASYDLDRGPFQDRDDRQERQNADSKRKRVNLNLNDLDADEISNLDDEDQLARHVMEMNGTSIDFSA